jgi:bacillithiol synthase
MEGTEFKDIKGFSKIFIDFVNKEPFINERFPSNSSLFNYVADFLDDKQKLSFGDKIYSIANDSMKHLNLYDKQIYNLHFLKYENTFVVVTSVLPYFLGGPLNIFFKIQGMIELCDRLKKLYNGCKLIPVIWIEDDVPEGLIASNINLLDKDYNVKQIHSLPDSTKLNRKVLANWKFDMNINSILERISNILPENEYKGEVFELFQDIYKEDKSLTDCFIELINYIFEDTGIIFIRSSLAREKDLWRELVIKEIDNPTETSTIINYSNKILMDNGYKLKPKVFDINLLYHKYHKCLKIEYHPSITEYQILNKSFSYKSLRELAYLDTTSFSPQIILKQLFRDAILPVAASIASPSEIAYSSQLLELYDWFDVKMPAYIPRHSATLLDIKGFEIFTKNHQDNKIFNFVFPKGNLQERIISGVYFMNLVGIERFKRLLQKITEKPPDKHYSVKI